MRILWSSSVAPKVNSRHKALHPVIIGWLFTQGQKTNEEVTSAHHKRWGLYFKPEEGFMGSMISVDDLFCIDVYTYSAPICKTGSRCTLWRRLFSASGIQEFVEAASFLHYIRHRSLISLEEINARLVFMRTEELDPKVSASALIENTRRHPIQLHPSEADLDPFTQMLTSFMWPSGLCPRRVTGSADLPGDPLRLPAGCRRPDRGANAALHQQRGQRRHRHALPAEPVPAADPRRLLLHRQHGPVRGVQEAAHASPEPREGGGRLLHPARARLGDPQTHAGWRILQSEHSHRPWRWIGVSQDYRWRLTDSRFNQQPAPQM